MSPVIEAAREIAWPWGVVFAAAATVAWLARRGFARRTDPRLRPLLERIEPLASSIEADEETYLAEVKRAVVELRFDVSPRSPVSGYRMTRIGESRRAPVRVYRIDFAPHARIDCHDHHRYNGVLRVLAGELRARTFDLAESSAPREAGGRLLLRTTGDRPLAAGDTATVSTKRDNFHELTAGPSGAVVLDVFTRLDEDAGSRYVDLDPAPMDGARELYAARWR